MKLTDLLAIHRQNTSEKSLSHNLGDGFLIRHNKMYRNVRTEAQLFGFQYVSAEPHQIAMPFLQLESILRDKKIPYIDNVSVLQSLSEKFSALSWHDIESQLKKNFIFHESCHAMARYYYQQHLKKEKVDLSGAADEVVTQIFIEESFANGCEFLAMQQATDAAHRIFYEQNSYTWLPEHRAQLKKTIDEVGEVSALKLLLVGYLYANFLKERISDQELDKILHLLDVSAKEIFCSRTIRSLLKLTFTLDYEFRTATSALHLKLNSLNIDPRTINIIERFEENPVHSKVIMSLCERALRQ